MNRPKNLGLFLLGIYLVVIALTNLLGIRLGLLSPAVPLLALVAGICLMVGK